MKALLTRLKKELQEKNQQPKQSLMDLELADYEKIIEKHSSDSSSQQTISSFDMNAKIKDYYQKIKPFSGMSDIFKNATGTINKYSTGLKGEKQYTIRCKNCAAPRLDTMQYDACLFCGSKLFEPIT